MALLPSITQSRPEVWIKFDNETDYFKLPGIKDIEISECDPQKPIHQFWVEFTTIDVKSAVDMLRENTFDLVVIVRSSAVSLGISGRITVAEDRIVCKVGSLTNFWIRLISLEVKPVTDLFNQRFDEDPAADRSENEA